MYQFSGHGGNAYIVMRLSIDSVVQPHTVSLTGNTRYAGNFGLWQGSLNSGNRKIVLQYRSSANTVNTVSSQLEWIRNHWNKWMNRAMTVIVC